jgi:nucleoside-diphosphate-sugar epimerase
MQLLITAAGAPLARALATELMLDHSVRLTDRQPSPLSPDLKSAEFVVSGLGDDDSTNLLVRGMDALVHVAEPLPNEAAESYLDYTTRCTYNLLWAAAQEQVRRVVYLSTLRLMSAYGPEYRVTERWRPRPTTEPALLGKHLGEFVCREFAREHRLQVVVLRLGTVIAPDQEVEPVAAPIALAQADAVQAVAAALRADLPRWGVLHVQGDFPAAQFPVDEAKRLLNFAPGATGRPG